MKLLPNETITEAFQRIAFYNLSETTAPGMTEAANCCDDEGEETDDDEDELDEVARKKVVRGGKIVKKVVCKPGFKFDGKKCTKISAKEKLNRSKGSKRGAKKKKGKSAQIAKKALRSKKKGKNL